MAQEELRPPITYSSVQAHLEAVDDESSAYQDLDNFSQHPTGAFWRGLDRIYTPTGEFRHDGSQRVIKERERKISLSGLLKVVSEAAHFGYAYKEVELAANPPTNVPLTAEQIQETLGFSLVVSMPNFVRDRAGIIGFHDKLERLGKDFGWHNILGTLFLSDEQRLSLGVFVDETALAPPAKTTRDIANIATAALFMVYDSFGDITRDELARGVSQESRFRLADVDRVMDDMFDDENPLLRYSSELGGTVFCTQGLWLLEDGFMHGEAAVDDMAIVEARLEKLGVFKYLGEPPVVTDK